MSDKYTMEYVNGKKFVYPKVIYKYRDWDNPNHQKILQENKIFLSSPRDFEDNMDCNVPEEFPKKKELYDFFFKKSKKKNQMLQGKSAEHLLSIGVSILH